ncbi:transporter substrate-binding domain-containing protein [Bradyrhizobium sp. AUGA SZCCT0222]|uniref:transporter substrate-binding domain-containing protein n=1 Tax=Bradyrhizobium sp. AUGA SZCCT0222 TaxID=2807668 RepID=UPI001BAD65B0|nr:transporter substrate-binding domain-containing protein [Bradyrhizobium sp. AUGA SZCCT0222]MBR1270146.1 transporter substrate-binding domain-containing protein [Bradyrhizobium sp. AUGA SZCCT0222]
MRLLSIFSALAVLIGLVPTAHAQSCTLKVPTSSLIEAGKWQMSINPTLPPQQFIDDKGELQGLNVELAREIAKRICIEPVFLRMDFPPMIPGLRSGRFDAINTGLFWTEERSKMLYLVPYAQQAISIYTDPASSLKLEKFEDLAGRIVGVESATYTERKAREFNTAMVAKGLKEIDLRTFTTVTATSAALRAGQLEAALNINETANSLEQRGIAKIWVRDIAGTDITFAFRDKLLAQAAADALTAIRTDGTYDKLFDKFGMTKLKATTFVIRGDGPTN